MTIAGTRGTIASLSIPFSCLMSRRVRHLRAHAMTVHLAQATMSLVCSICLAPSLMPLSSSRSMSRTSSLKRIVARLAWCTAKGPFLQCLLRFRLLLALSPPRLFLVCRLRRYDARDFDLLVWPQLDYLPRSTRRTSWLDGSEHLLKKEGCALASAQTDL